MSTSDQSTENSNKNTKDSFPGGLKIILFLWLLLLVGGVFLFFLLRKDDTVPPQVEIIHDTVVVHDTVYLQSVPKTGKNNKPSGKRDSLVTAPQDTIVPSVKITAVMDTISPWVYPDPSGGLHYGTIAVMFAISEPCSLVYRKKETDPWIVWKAGEEILIDKNTSLCYEAWDTAGNHMPKRCEQYEISTPLAKKFCPANMEYVKVGTQEFCIDRYEWPNVSGAKPAANISLYQALDSCFMVQKRLCTTREWSAAASGPYDWKYPYGQEYEPNACNTTGKGAVKSGSRRECRSYFGMYDMSGNLAEWTHTKSETDRSFYNVMGGFWDSGPAADCFTKRYSYYPENGHNPIGFRCCKDAVK